MADDGFEFGSHTVSHPVLSRLSAEEQAREVARARDVLEAGLGRPVRAFAYPYGREWDYDDRSVDALRRAGYVSAAASMPGLVGPNTDPFRLLRIPLRETTSLPKLRAALHGLYDLAGRLLRVSLAGDP
jgi:peptidoglycan/xylan/chitin deacetylase (PgdA/CDA1 family)